MLSHYRFTRTDKAAEYFDEGPSLRVLKTSSGTYALILLSAREDVIRVGRLGDLRLQRGFYVYIGSALGQGDVRGRLAHHLQPAERPHWHIDYLRVHTTIEEIWFSYDIDSKEHAWAGCIAGMPGASMPLAGFGSSDCDCKSHLFFSEKRPAWKEFDRQLWKTSLRSFDAQTASRS
jgi:Uri superfamily endonuclease